jgi:hypothetical protein
MSISFTHNYEFSNGEIFELGFNKASDNSRYQWYLIYNGTRHNLTLIKISDMMYDFVCDAYFCVFLDMNTNELSIFNNKENQKGVYIYKITENI